MRFCNNCKIQIIDKNERCPLCHCVTSPVKDETGTLPDHAMYPNAASAVRRFNFFGNLILLLSVFAAILCPLINRWTTPDFFWSGFVLLGLVYINALVHLAILGKSGYRVKVIAMLVLAVVLLFGIDYMTEYQGWSLNYAAPTAVLVLDVCVLLSMIINYRNWQSYMMTQLTTILISLVLIILVWCDFLTARYYVYSSFLVSLFIFLGTLIMGDRRARSELKRRFHF